MSGKTADNGFAAALRRLQSTRSMLALTHARPDGDGLGAILALVRSARAAGRQAKALVPDKVPARYEFVFEDDLPAGAQQFEALADQADLIVVADTSARGQLDGVDKGIVARMEKVVVIDHHATSEQIGAVQWIDPSVAAAGVMVGELLEALGWPIDERTAEALVVATTSDTGWLRFANTDGRCLRAVADWLDSSVRPDKLYMRLYQADRPQRLRLMVRTLESLQLDCGGRLASMVLRKRDFADTGAAAEETENLVNEALRMGCVDTALLLVESEGVVRVSLRSRDAVDVAAVAERFGGGGHARAAGLRVAMDIDALRIKLVEACAEELRKSR